MHLSKIYFAAFFYVVATTLLLVISLPHDFLFQKPQFFFDDPTIATSVHNAIILNPNTKDALTTRIFHNKIGFSLNNIFLSLARSTDPVFFFSLFPNPYYGDSYYLFAPFYFFPFFIIGSLTLIWQWQRVKKRYAFLVYFYLVAICVDVLFIPYTAPIKLLPLYICVQLTIFFGCIQVYKSLREK